MDNKNNLSKDPERENAKQQLLQLLNEYLRTFRDDIPDSVYFFFAPYHLEGPMVYSNAAASALCLFASKRKARAFIKDMGADNYYVLCNMLQNVIQFCNNIASREPNLVRLDKSKLERASNIPLVILLSEKKEYEYKLMELRDRLKRNLKF